MDAAELATLRRPYTRTVSADIRPLPVLALSFADATRQWRDLVIERRHVDIQEAGARPLHCPPKNATLSDAAVVVVSADKAARQALAALERIASQLKAVKQELVVLAGRAPFPVAPQAAPHDDPESQDAVTWPFIDTAIEAAFFGSLVSPPVAPFTGGGDSTDDSWCELRCLQRRVWVWSILVGLTLADLDLLAGSLATAQQELFAEADFQSNMPSGNNKKDGDERNRASGSELVSFFTLCPAGEGTNTATTCDASESAAFPLDSLFISAASLLYSVLTGDDAAASRAAQRWTDISSLLVYSINDGDDYDYGEDDEEGDGIAVRGVEALSTAEATAVYAIVRTVSGLASCLAAGDPRGASAVLSCLCGGEEGGGEQSSMTPPSRMSAVCAATTDPSARAMLRSLLLGLQLLLRMLSELNTRRALLHEGAGNAYRPVIIAPPEAAAAAAAAAVGAAAANNAKESGATVTLLSPCISDLLPPAGCTRCVLKPPLALVPEQDGCLGHWPRRIQLQRLKDLGGPWPLPRDLVVSSFAFPVHL